MRTTNTVGRPPISVSNLVFFLRSNRVGLVCRYQYPYQHMEGVPLPPGMPGLVSASTDPLEAVLGAFPCVKIKNLPPDATLEDILVLFQGLVVIDVVITGTVAFVIFANPMDFQMALQR